VAEVRKLFATHPSIETVIEPRTHDLGGFNVQRVLPSARRRMVGPFIFLDQFGPAEFLIGKGIDVRPHPHIGLATLTYLFQGEITHRDSTGVEQVVRPGEVNLMTAGRGIVHSERTPDEARKHTQSVFGLQCWLALPKAHEETEPGFTRHDKDALPTLAGDGLRGRVAVGGFLGEHSAVPTASETLLVDLSLDEGTTLPVDNDYEERAVYVISGSVTINGDPFEEHQMAVIAPGATATVTLERTGDTLTSSKERIEQAKADWLAQRFDIVPGDTEEYIPLPDS